jgi:hypothetical protein
VADRYLLESGAPDGYLLEDGTGVLLLEGPLPDDNTENSWWSGAAQLNYVGVAQSLLAADVSRNVLTAQTFNKQEEVAVGFYGGGVLRDPVKIIRWYSGDDFAVAVAATPQFEEDAIPVYVAPAPIPVNVVFTWQDEQVKPVVYEEDWSVFTPAKLDAISSLWTHQDEIPHTVVEEDWLQLTTFPNLATIRVWIDQDEMFTTGSVSGTLASTNANDTLVAAGTTTVTGTLADTNNNDTLAASGTTTVTGTLASSNNNDTLAASGSVGSAVSGTLASTNNNDTLAASGSPVIVGTLASTNANDSLVASGTTTIVGSLSTTNNNDTMSASGTSGTPPTTRSQLPVTGAGQS